MNCPSCGSKCGTFPGEPDNYCFQCDWTVSERSAFSGAQGPFETVPSTLIEGELE